MRVLLWGDWLPEHVESQVLEFRARGWRPRLALQLDPAAKAVDYCNVQADEIVRARAIDSDAFRASVVSQGSPRVALNFWGMMGRKDFSAFLNGLESIALASETMVCWMPRPWAASGVQLLGERSEISSRLADRTRKAFESAWNGSSQWGAVLSGPTRESLATLVGRKDLGPLPRVGLSLWPTEMQTMEAKFVERAVVARAVADRLDAGRTSTSWMLELASDEVYRPNSVPGRLGGLSGCRWESYCLTPLLPHLVHPEDSVSAASLAQWHFQLAAVEANHLRLQQQREAMGRAVFPA